jgi:hypothetical protein
MLEFRFGVAMVGLVACGLFASSIEAESLDLTRQLSYQQFRLQVIDDQLARLRLEAQQLGAPERLLKPLEDGTLTLKRPDKPVRPEQPVTPQTTEEE